MPSLYASLLGPSWTALDPAVQRLHGAASGKSSARGVMAVRRGKSWLARLVAAVMGMPREAEASPVHLSVERVEDTESWSRRFGDQPLRTVQWATDGLLVEGMGPVQCWFRLRADQGALVFEQVRSTFGPRRLALPLPRVLAPRIEGRASSAERGVLVDIRIALPIVGLVISYRGIVEDVP